MWFFLGCKYTVFDESAIGFHDLFSFHSHVVLYLCTTIMSRYLTKFISVFLIAATLFASTGVVIASHICSSKKTTDVSLFQHKGCCSKKDKDCTSSTASSIGFRKNCCQLSVSYNKLNVNSVQKNGALHSDIIAPAAKPSFQKKCSLIKTFVRKAEYQSGGLDFLLRIHLLLI